MLFYFSAGVKENVSRTAGISLIFRSRNLECADLLNEEFYYSACFLYICCACGNILIQRAFLALKVECISEISLDNNTDIRPIIMESKSKMGLWAESQLSSFGLASIPAISGCTSITDRLRGSDQVPWSRTYI